MKRIIKVFTIALCLGLIFVSTGCFSKSPITSEKFKNVVKESGLTVTDVKSQFANVSYIKEAWVARNDSKGYQIEFYVLSDDTNAIEFYNQNKTIFEQAKSGSNVEAKVSGKNYEKYSLKVDDKYKLLSRVENTVLYLNVNSQYQDEVVKIVDELKY